MPVLRQGDVLLVAVEEIPIGALPVPAAEHRGRMCLVVARGERTGHAHTLPADHAVLLRATDASGNLEGFAEVLTAGVALAHEEHRSLPIPVGRYRVIMQRQYDPIQTGGLPVID